MADSGQSITKRRFAWRIEVQHRRSGGWIEWGRYGSREKAEQMMADYIADGYTKEPSTWAAMRVVEKR